MKLSYNIHLVYVQQSLLIPSEGNGLVMARGHRKGGGLMELEASKTSSYHATSTGGRSKIEVAIYL